MIQKLFLIIFLLIPHYINAQEIGEKLKDETSKFPKISKTSNYCFSEWFDNLTLEFRIYTAELPKVGLYSKPSKFGSLYFFSFKHPNDHTLEKKDSLIDKEKNKSWQTYSFSFTADDYLRMYEEGIIIDSIDIKNFTELCTSYDLFDNLLLSANKRQNKTVTEIRIWRTAIPENTIKNWYKVTLNSTHPNFPLLIGYWKNSK